MLIKVFRCEPEAGIPERFDSYEVPVPTDDEWTVMDVLDYISLKLDPSVAYYKHSACDHGICGRCLLNVNGKARLACVHTVAPDISLTLEPFPGGEKIRDLVVRQNTPDNPR